MRSLLNDVGVRADGVRESCGLTNGEGGIRGAEVDLDMSFSFSLSFSLSLSQLHEFTLPALDGCEVGVDFSDLSEKLVLRLEEGVETAGDSALRKSV